MNSENECPLPNRHLKRYEEEHDRRAGFFITLVALGYTTQQIAERFEISYARVGQIVRRERRRKEREFKHAEFYLTYVERSLTGNDAIPKVISKVSCPLIDTGSDPTIASGGST